MTAVIAFDTWLVGMSFVDGGLLFKPFDRYLDWKQN
jgi:hypothetical protein